MKINLSSHTHTHTQPFTVDNISHLMAVILRQCTFSLSAQPSETSLFKLMLYKKKRRKYKTKNSSELKMSYELS